MKRGVSRFSVENFGSHSAEKFRGQPFNVSENLGYRKILCIIGVSQFSVENFLSHSAEKFRGHPFKVSENLGYRKILCIIGGITILRRKFFVSAEKFRGNPFNVSENLGYRKILCIIGVSQFSVENFLSHSAEKFRGHPFNVSEILGYRKILCIIRGITSFRRNFFCLTVPKNFVKEPFSVPLISGIKKC